MKKLIIVATALLASACGGGMVSNHVSDADEVVEFSTTTTEATTTTTEATTTTVAVRPTVPSYQEPPMNGYQPDVFIEFMVDWAIDWYFSYADDDLIEIGLLVCQSLDAGERIEAVLWNILEVATELNEGMADTTGYFMRGTVRYLCPEHYRLIEQIN